MKHINTSHLINVFILISAFFMFKNKIPLILTQYKNEGQTAPLTTVYNLKSEPIHLPLPKKQILIFWATWCEPCKIELGRINKLILNQEILADSVLAIAVNETEDVVTEFTVKQKYLFNIAIDKSGQASNLYHVSGTPTLVLIDQNQKIMWMTTGISPSLEFRIRSFLKN